MNRKLIIIVTIIGLSIIAFFLMYKFTDFGMKKSLFITGGAGMAMIIFDVIAVNRNRVDK